MKTDVWKVPAPRVRQAQRHDHRQRRRERGKGSALQTRCVLLHGLAALGAGSRLGRGTKLRHRPFVPMRQRMPQRALLTKQQQHGQQASQPTRMQEGGAEKAHDQGRMPARASSDTARQCN